MRGTSANVSIAIFTFRSRSVNLSYPHQMTTTKKPWDDEERIDALKETAAGRPEAEAPKSEESGRKSVADSGVSPIYTVILHEPRKKLGLSVNEYTIIDTIDRLSNRPPDYVWCRKSIDSIANDLGVNRATVFRAIKKAVDQELVEKEGNRKLGHRSTPKWFEAVVVHRHRIRKGKVL